MKYEMIYGFVGILIALIYFVGALLLCARGIRRASLHTREVREDVERMDMRYVQLEKHLEIALATIEVRKGRLTQIAQDLATLREETTSLIMRNEAPIYLLSDRWTMADTEFLVTITNGSMVGRPVQKFTIQSWADGRTYVVWAPNTDIAARLVEARFAAGGGYEAGAMIASPLNLAKRWEVAS